MLKTFITLCFCMQLCSLISDGTVVPTYVYMRRKHRVLIARMDAKRNHWNLCYLKLFTLFVNTCTFKTKLVFVTVSLLPKLPLLHLLNLPLLVLISLCLRSHQELATILANVLQVKLKIHEVATLV